MRQEKTYAGWLSEEGDSQKGDSSPLLFPNSFPEFFEVFVFRLRRRLRRGENYTIQVIPQGGALGSCRVRPKAKHCKGHGDYTPKQNKSTAMLVKKGRVTLEHA